MGLLTHNMVSCNIKGVSNRYPMKLEVEKWVMKETKLNADFLHNIFPKIEWLALVDAAEAFGCPDLSTGLLDLTMLGSNEFLHKFHHALLELHVERAPTSPSVPRPTVDSPSTRASSTCSSTWMRSK